MIGQLEGIMAHGLCLGRWLQMVNVAWYILYVLLLMMSLGRRR